MAIKSGFKGKITFGGAIAGKVTDWSVEISGATLDSSGLGDEWDSKIASTKSWSGSLTCLIDVSATGADLTIADLGVGTSAALELFIDDTTANTYSGFAIIDSYSTGASRSDILKCSVSFSGDGELSIT